MQIRQPRTLDTSAQIRINPFTKLNFRRDSETMEKVGITIPVTEIYISTCTSPNEPMVPETIIDKSCFTSRFQTLTFFCLGKRGLYDAKKHHNKQILFHDWIIFVMKKNRDQKRYPQPNAITEELSLPKTYLYSTLRKLRGLRL